MIRFLIPALALAALCAGPALPGPLFDPFLEGFQVGAYRQDFPVDPETGLPRELMVPVRCDTVWLAAARVAVEEEAAGLLPALLGHLLDPGAASAWRERLAASLDDLAADGRLSEDPAAFLAAPLAARRVFSLVSAGELEAAAGAAAWIHAHADALGLPPRTAFVWELRALHLEALVSDEAAGPTGPWPAFLELAPWDKGNAWAIWRAQARHFHASLLPDHVQGRDWAVGLAQVADAGISRSELENSAFAPGLVAGLGGVLFQGGDLAEHLAEHDAPPADFTAQGWWVRGHRTKARGRAQAYEKLAGDARLAAGWRMDVWRRASERRLLKGHWEMGLQDLKVALVLAERGSGTAPLRRRLRQWAEQALVLALSEGRTGIAREIRELGLKHLKGDDRKAFLAEVGHWDDLLGIGELPDPAAGLKPAAAHRVARGDASAVFDPDDVRRQEFRDAADRDLWDLWFRWGWNLADPEPVTGDVRRRAILYRDAIDRALAGDAAALRDSALALIAMRFRDRPEAEDLLRQAFHFDVARLCAGGSPAEPSGIPALEQALRGSELDRHALLGLALAGGDMRGILAVAVNLPGRGLAPGEMIRFLYPLPAEGVVRDALLAADSDPALILAVARNESLFEPTVRSRAGALGFMQIMPFHYEERGARPGERNWSNPALSIARGDRLLVENMKRYDGDPYRTAAAYNAGPGAATRWTQQLGPGRTPAMYLAWIGYPETRHYVEKVLIDREIYDAIIDGDDAR